MKLELKAKQNQTMSQRMLQSMSILQMTEQELENYLDEAALENPVLDIERPSGESIDIYRQNRDNDEYEHYLGMRRNGDDDFDPKGSWNLSTCCDETLKDSLLSQLNLGALGYRNARVVMHILDNLDDRGYIAESTEEIAGRMGESTEAVEECISILQGLEPIGVCARSLEECLCMQLGAAGRLDDTLKLIIQECLPLIAKDKYAAIASKLNITTETAVSYAAMIKALDPMPGSHYYSHSDAAVIIPDVIVKRMQGNLVLEFNSGSSPSVSVNSYYQKMYDNASGDPELSSYLQNKINQVKWIRNCISQRQSTLLAITEEICRHQSDFFMHDNAELRPLRMSDIAAAAGMHESTVSRAVDNKYLQCRLGVFPYSYFFARRATGRDRRAVSMEDQSHTGDGVRSMLQEILETESHEKPYSDRILCEKLAEKGITVSRRTITKYREELGIPDASGRKNLYRKDCR